MRNTSTPICDAKDCNADAVAQLNDKDEYLCYDHLIKWRQEVFAAGGEPTNYGKILTPCQKCGTCQYDNKLEANGICYDCNMTENMPPTPYRFDDPVNHPQHYTHPSGVECITVTEHMNFCLGNAMKYLWRAEEKGNAIEDLKKARWYIDREIERREK